jgi:DNA gyrase/topoisomerase IV subunit B
MSSWNPKEMMLGAGVRGVKTSFRKVRFQVCLPGNDEDVDGAESTELTLTFQELVINPQQPIPKPGGCWV